MFLGNEAEHEGDSDDSDINDSESIPGSEASSTTADLSEANFNMPGLDDNEGRAVYYSFCPLPPHRAKIWVFNDWEKKYDQ